MKNGFDESLGNDTALIHVRRGDFLRDNRQLNIKYYEESIEFMKKKDIKKFHIFTDDDEWVSNQKIFENCEKIISQKSGKEKKIS